MVSANGAGKSTILRILATLLVPTRGQAFVSGHDTAKDPRAVRRKLGYHTGSDQGFYPRLSGRQNLLFFGQLNHLTRAQAFVLFDSDQDFFFLVVTLVAIPGAI